MWSTLIGMYAHITCACGYVCVRAHACVYWANNRPWRNCSVVPEGQGWKARCQVELSSPEKAWAPGFAPGVDGAAGGPCGRAFALGWTCRFLSRRHLLPAAPGGGPSVWTVRSHQQPPLHRPLARPPAARPSRLGASEVPRLAAREPASPGPSGNHALPPAPRRGRADPASSRARCPGTRACVSPGGGRRAQREAR